MDTPRTTTRPNVFASLVAIALGANLWLAMIAIPGNSLSAWTSWALLGAGILPLMVLILAVWCRSEAILLFGFLSALLVPSTLIPDLVSFEVYGPLRFAIVAISLWAFLFGAPLLTSGRVIASPIATRSLQTKVGRGTRFLHIYFIFPLLALGFPLTLLYFINFDSTNRVLLSQTFGDRPAPILTLFNIVALGLWFVTFFFVFYATLNQHRYGDRSLRIELAKLKTSKPNLGRLAVYGGTVFALVFLILFLWYT